MAKMASLTRVFVSMMMRWSAGTSSAVRLLMVSKVLRKLVTASFLYLAFPHLM